MAYASAQFKTEGIKLPLPKRQLEWKDVNFLSISDTHGELAETYDGNHQRLTCKDGYWAISM